MNYANPITSHAVNQHVLRRIEKTILIAAAALAVTALVAHHTGLSAVITLVALLIITILERLKSLPAEESSSSLAKAKYRFSDGGSFRTVELEKKTPVKPSTVVIDGGTRH